jgi:hypothetical protein
MTAKTIATQSQGEGPSSVGRVSPLICAGAGLSLVAALVHLWVAPEHFGEWWGYGLFMLVCALCQGLFAPLILRFPGSRLILLCGIAGNLVIVLLYVIAHTWGMPFGTTWVPFDPSVAHLEDADVAGVAATAAEVGTAYCLVAALEGSLHRLVINLLLVLGASLWVLRIAGILP